MKLWKPVSSNMQLHIPSGVYYARKSRKGKGRFFKTTGEKRKARAQSMADLMIGEWIHGKKKHDRTALLGEILNDLDQKLSLECDNNERRVNTRKKDAYILPLMKEHFGEIPLADMDEAWWDNWVLTRGRKLDRTLGDFAKYVSLILSFALELKLIDRKPEIRNPDPAKKGIITYTPAQIQMFWEHAHPDLKDMIILGGEVGLRPHENQGLDYDWITVPRGKGLATIKIPDWFEKRNKGREIVVSEAATKVIRRRQKSRRGRYVFPAPKDPNKSLSGCQLSRYWRRSVTAVNEELAKKNLDPFPVGRDGGIRFHWLRHTFFTRALLEAKKELPMVAAYGGNSPRILYDRYMSKDANRTAGMAGAVTLDLKNDRSNRPKGQKKGETSGKKREEEE